MSLGEKLQNAYKKVNTKLATQDASVIFRKKNITASDTFGKPYASATNTDVTISAGLKLSRVKAYEVDGSGRFQVGDLKLTVPGSLIAESQLKDSNIVYNSKIYSILDYRPSGIYSGVVVNWIIVARISPNG